MSSSGRSSRRKGKAAELEIVHIARAAGFPEARRTGPTGQIRGDIDNVPPLYLEVRRRENLAIPSWAREVEAEAPAGQIPVVVFRRSQEPWRAVLPFGDLLELVKGLE